MTAQSLPRLHIVTDDAVLQRSDFSSTAASILAALGPRVALHLRSNSASGAQLFHLASRLVPTADSSGALLCVNNRVDVALVTGAGAVQLNTRSLPVGAARTILGAARIIGFSVHPDHAIEDDVAEGANFLLAGSIYQTTSHPGAVPAGTAFLADLRSQQSLPVVAIGGVTAARVAETLRAGAHGVAVISAVWKDADPVQAAQELARILYNDDRN